MTDDELRALCLAATPGPWAAAPHGTGADLQLSGVQPAVIRDDPDGWHPTTVALCVYQTAEDARFIAAANPQTVLALLDRLTELRAAVAYWRDAWAKAQVEVDARPYPQEAKAEIAALRAAALKETP